MRVQKTRDTQHIFAVGTGSLLPENIKKSVRPKGRPHLYTLRFFLAEKFYQKCVQTVCKLAVRFGVSLPSRARPSLSRTLSLDENVACPLDKSTLDFPRDI